MKKIIVTLGLATIGAATPALATELVCSFNAFKDGQSMSEMKDLCDDKLLIVNLDQQIEHKAKCTKKFTLTIKSNGDGESISYVVTDKSGVPFSNTRGEFRYNRATSFNFASSSLVASDASDENAVQDKWVSLACSDH